MIQLDGPSDMAVGGGEIPPLGGVATQIELDQRILGMKGSGLGKNFGGGFQGIAPALGEGPSHEPARLVGMGGGQFGGERGGFRPILRPFQKTEFKLHHASIGCHGRGEVVEFLECVIDHAKVGVADCAFGMPKILL